MKTLVTTKLDEFFRIYDTSFDVNMHPSLYSGQSGMLLFRFYYQAFLKQDNPKLEADLIDFISAQLENGFGRPTFSNGLTGFGWFVQHLHNQEFIELDESVLGFFDRAIVDSARNKMTANNHDFMHGALGDMIYLIERIAQNPTLKTDLLELFFLLEKTAIRPQGGIAWYESSDFLEGEENSTVINLHISHGQASKIFVLTQMLALGITEVQPILEQAIDFLLVQTDIETGLIPTRLVDDKKYVKTHLGWCRSNIAIGLALHQAANILKDGELEKCAVSIGLNMIDLNPNTAQMPSDATFCHGKIGISHMFNRYHQYTGLSEFKEASDVWMKHTLNAANFEDGIAGFKSWDSFQKQWENKYGLLTGTAGIGLGLLSYLSDDPKLCNWDRCFLLS